MKKVGSCVHSFGYITAVILMMIHCPCCSTHKPTEENLHFCDSIMRANSSGATCFDSWIPTSMWRKKEALF